MEHKLSVPRIVVHSPEGILVQEVDEGQPCLACGEKCPGFSLHVWRNTCNNCRCPREIHDVYHEEVVNVRDRLGWKKQEDPKLQVVKERALKEGYTWVPPGLSSHKIEEYMEQLPNHKIPKIGSPGEKYRDIQLIVQLPKQDLSSEYCKSLSSEEEKKEFKEFRTFRDENVMEIGYARENTTISSCYNCQGEVDAGEVAVFAPKVGLKACWHPACFVCDTCDELLVDLTYCHKDSKVYCERHYAELIKPRCPACDELVFSGEYTKAMEQNFHKEHLCCWKCDKRLVACRYIVKEEHPYCIPCYQELFAHNCEECKKPIGPDYKDLSYKDRHWHELCFKCSECQNSLVDQPFASKNDQIYCAECHDNKFAGRCDGCSGPFRGGMKKFEYKGKQWHEECFCCMVCKEPIRNKSFIPREGEVVCVPCYEEQYAQRCTKCEGVINKGGVAYKNTPWHRECFTCTNCDLQLAGEKFTSVEEKPYCAKCYAELFAKKCCRCSDAITGFGGTKYISFEERHWHSDCFVCYKCETSMVGRGFLMNEGDIVCPQCGRS
ncbi:four and a half LIM domains protein 2-like isoform X2 [Liolophura sinensis]|uniref:four and a half LIM domains protein 2-like isoform X2 n=1 Tax=Liolophura sinensis TaxID=3198878 RepID=UPI003158F009